MIYFLMQLHFWMYTHTIKSDYILSLIIGMAIGLILFA